MISYKGGWMGIDGFRCAPLILRGWMFGCMLLAALGVLTLLAGCGDKGGDSREAGSPRTPSSHAPAVVTGKKIALVIGNSAYPDKPLKNPVNDAGDMAEKLKALGFEVTVATDADQKQMLRALTEFGEKVSNGAVALFYYAGHGMQVRGKNYLIPVDAKIKTESAVGSEAVDVDQLLAKLGPARLSMVILDACRNNPFERAFRGDGQGLAQINAPTGTLIAYATAPGKVSADGEGRNGAYTAELLAAMSEPGLKIEDVFKRVRGNVISKTGNAQTPWESSSLTGDFYFMMAAPPPPVAIVATPTAVELSFWDSIKASDDASDFEAYLRKFPKGNYKELAENRLRRLNPVAITSDQNHTKKVKFIEVVQAASARKVAVEICAQNLGTLTDCTGGSQGVPADLADAIGYVASITTIAGVIKVTAIGTGGLNSETYILTPTAAADGYNVTWAKSGTCTNSPAIC